MAGDSETLVAAVTDPTRRQMLDLLLAHGETTATALAAELPVTRQAVAKHLAVLDRVGLVEGRREGRELRFHINIARLDEANRSLEELAAGWDRRLLAIKKLAEAERRRKR
jgi:DNA-binding transcriptional ArsR family regulator